MVVDVDCVHVDHVECVDEWLEVVDDVGVDDVGCTQMKIQIVGDVDEVLER